LDLRETYILTIDPERARDFDDALSLTQNAEGQRILGVHIADVSHFVYPGSALDAEAHERGNSVYFADKVLPMLPEQLSNGICSLKPNEDRLTFSVFMTVDASGTVIKREFAKSVIRSRLRLTYEQAMQSLQSHQGGGPAKTALPAEAADLLHRLNDLAQQLRRRRFAQHALDLEMAECEVVMGPDGRMTGIRLVHNDASHQLVEECMVAANEAVAFELGNNGIPLVSRLHEPPHEDKIAEATLHLESLGYSPGNLNQPAHLAAFLRSIEDDPLAFHLRMAVLRSLKRAMYSATARGHFGLAKKHYAHFTSPIRRYPDLLVHRQLADMLARGQARHQDKCGARHYTAEQLSQMAEHCSRTEQTAEEAERALLEIKKYRFLAEQLERQRPTTYEAVVVNVTNFGLFIEVLDLQIQGLVHVSQISDRFVKFNRRQGSLEAGKDKYRVGRKVRVFVTGVDFDKRRIDFGLVKGR
jgi:ribonuclease R